MGLIGGGGAGFIGKVHVTAATLDRQAELVAGALSSDPVRAKSYAAAFGISEDRAYGSYLEMLACESELSEERRIDFVSIATPNHTHCEIALAALAAGFHVVCDKPMTTNLDDAKRIVDAVNRSGRVFALTHNYSGYPMIRQARDMILDGQLGDLIAVRANYIQGWMQGVDASVKPQRGAWKSDPSKNGLAGSLGDVGTHAFHLVRFVTGLQPESLLSRMKSYSDHHQLDDYGHAVIQFDQGATGLVTWSQVTHGRLNDVSLEIDGTKASLAWRQEEPNQLVVRSLGRPAQIYECNPGADYFMPSAIAACRIPAGHPEAFFEAFANIYRDAFVDMRRHGAGQELHSASLYPKVEDGHDGVKFMMRCLSSHNDHSAWHTW
jgi:predicted dehydrogenase